MRRNRLRNGLLVLAVVVALIAIAILLGLFRPSTVAPGVEQPLTEAQIQELLPRGRELALAGNCMGCHSKVGEEKPDLKKDLTGCAKSKCHP